MSVIQTQVNKIFNNTANVRRINSVSIRFPKKDAFGNDINNGDYATIHAGYYKIEIIDKERDTMVSNPDFNSELPESDTNKTHILGKETYQESQEILIEPLVITATAEELADWGDDDNFLNILLDNKTNN